MNPASLLNRTCENCITASWTNDCWTIICTVIISYSIVSVCPASGVTFNVSKGSATLAQLRNDIVAMDFNIATIASWFSIDTKSLRNRGSVAHALLDCFSVQRAILLYVLSTYLIRLFLCSVSYTSLRAINVSYSIVSLFSELCCSILTPLFLSVQRAVLLYILPHYFSLFSQLCCSISYPIISLCSASCAALYLTPLFLSVQWAVLLYILPHYFSLFSELCCSISYPIISLCSASCIALYLTPLFLSVQRAVLLYILPHYFSLFSELCCSISYPIISLCSASCIALRISLCSARCIALRSTRLFQRAVLLYILPHYFSLFSELYCSTYFSLFSEVYCSTYYSIVSASCAALYLTPLFLSVQRAVLLYVLLDCFSERCSSTFLRPSAGQPSAWYSASRQSLSCRRSSSRASDGAPVSRQQTTTPVPLEVRRHWEDCTYTGRQELETSKDNLAIQHRQRCGVVHICSQCHLVVCSDDAAAASKAVASEMSRRFWMIPGRLRADVVEYV